MHLMLMLCLLAATISSASLFSSQHYHQDSSQQPLERIANLPPDPCVQSSFSPGYGRCYSRHHWCCTLFRHKLYCGCCVNRKSGHASDTFGLSRAETRAQMLAEIQDVTTLEVVAEIEPGNNDTLLSLFEVQCEKGHHVACSQTDCGFACGCYENWDTTDVAPGEYAGRVSDGYRERGDFRGRNAEPDSREPPGPEFSKERSGNHDGGVEVDQQEEYSDFSFQSIYWRRCPPDLFWQCCPVGCLTKCFCSDGGDCQ